MSHLTGQADALWACLPRLQSSYIMQAITIGSDTRALRRPLAASCVLFAMQVEHSHTFL